MVDRLAETTLTTYTRIDEEGREWKVTELAPSYTPSDLQAASISSPIMKRSEREQALRLGGTRDYI